MNKGTTQSAAADPQCWLIVERLENWEVDRRSEFRFFGLPDKLAQRASHIRTGDHFVVYVSSGISSFVGIRRATSDKLAKLSFGGDYDTAFPICVRTENILSLERKNWIHIKTLVPYLSFTRDKRDWRQVMRGSLRLLSVEDAKLIQNPFAGGRS